MRSRSKKITVPTVQHFPVVPLPPPATLPDLSVVKQEQSKAQPEEMNMQDQAVQNSNTVPSSQSPDEPREQDLQLQETHGLPMHQNQHRPQTTELHPMHGAHHPGHHMQQMHPDHQRQAMMQTAGLNHASFLRNVPGAPHGQNQFHEGHPDPAGIRLGYTPRPTMSPHYPFFSNSHTPFAFSIVSLLQYDLYVK